MRRVRRGETGDTAWMQTRTRPIHLIVFLLSISRRYETVMTEIVSLMASGSRSSTRHDILTQWNCEWWDRTCVPLLCSEMVWYQLIVAVLFPNPVCLSSWSFQPWFIIPIITFASSFGREMLSFSESWSRKNDGPSAAISKSLGHKRSHRIHSFFTALQLLILTRNTNVCSGMI